jgi:hypothetical protein
MNETAFTAKLRKFLEESEGGSIKLGASVFLAKGTPDMICFYRGETFFLEDKVYPNKLSPIQKATIDKIRKEGGYAWCAVLTDNGIVVENERFDDERGLFEWCIHKIRTNRGADKSKVY